jgi:hypothetical protein
LLTGELDALIGSFAVEPEDAALDRVALRHRPGFLQRGARELRPAGWRVSGGAPRP